LSCG